MHREHNPDENYVKNKVLMFFYTLFTIWLWIMQCPPCYYLNTFQ